jgi:hypothetical protein
MAGRRHSQFKRILIGFDGSSQSENEPLATGSRCRAGNRCHEL